VPTKPAVPADCAIKAAGNVANSASNEATASHTLSGFLNLITPGSPLNSGLALKGRRLVLELLFWKMHYIQTHSVKAASSL
jgi:hypothetical protein